MDAKYYNGDDERELSAPPEEEPDACPHCEARDGEAHQEACQLFVPLCGCGRRAKLVIAGSWYCTTCAPHGQVKAA
jgi:hypothetical protein